MTLVNLTDANLLDKTEQLVREERELLSKVLHCFREIERRRLYSAYGYKSLFDMAVRKFRYSEDQAYRRISAMKLLKELPELEEKISSGELSLTHVGIAQSLFKSEFKSGNSLSKTQKLETFEKIAAKPTREAEKIVLASASTPVTMRADSIRSITDEKTEFKFLASAELEKKIETLKGLFAHKAPNISLGELIEKACDLAIAELDPGKSKSLKKIAAPRKRCVVNSATKAISKAEVRRAVYRRAQNKCEKCGSQHALEIDHIMPQALGGSSKPENLRLLCRKCNQRAAIENLGLQKMDWYLNKSDS